MPSTASYRLSRTLRFLDDLFGKRALDPLVFPLAYFPQYKHWEQTPSHYNGHEHVFARRLLSAGNRHQSLSAGRLFWEAACPLPTLLHYSHVASDFVSI